MEKFSKLIPKDGIKTGPGDRLSSNIPLLPYFQDHRFMGKAVLPAVEAMQILAKIIKKKEPHIEVLLCRDISFKKFLALEWGASDINILVDFNETEDGGITASLLTRKQLKSAGMSRVLPHATLTFGGDHHQKESAPPDRKQNLQGEHRLIPTHRIYKDLVPFGPAYQNMINDLVITPTGAQADIQTPGRTNTGPLGSPFTLDAAFHGACVWGQCYLGFVPFPVGIDKRLISQPTASNRCYRATITPTKATSDQLMVDIRIYDERSQLCETALGIRMVDVSQGRLKPPDWIIQ